MDATATTSDDANMQDATGSDGDGASESGEGGGVRRRRFCQARCYTSGRVRTQDERPVPFVAVGDVLRDRGGPRKAGKGARWAIGRFRLAAEVTGKVTLLLLG